MREDASRHPADSGDDLRARFDATPAAPRRGAGAGWVNVMTALALGMLAGGCPTRAPGCRETPDEAVAASDCAEEVPDTRPADPCCPQDADADGGAVADDRADGVATAEAADARGPCDPRCAAAPFLRGVNVAGAEFGEGALPGTPGVDYLWPSPANGYSVRYFTDRRMNALRLPFRWERLQPTLRGPLDPAERERLSETVAHFKAAGAVVILDPHNYARYGGQVLNESAVTSADFADLWARLAALYPGDPQVIFGLMNEPHDLDTAHWVDAANAALAAIRAAGADNLVLVPGNFWSGGHAWSATWIPASQRNAVAMQRIVDPGGRFAFEVHQYLDADFSGKTPSCVSATHGSEALAPFTAWLREHGYRGFVGELGAGSDATCLAALGDLIAHIEANADVYLGWTYWAAGPWWGDYFTSLEPGPSGDKPQLRVLERFLR